MAQAMQLHIVSSSSCGTTQAVQRRRPNTGRTAACAFAASCSPAVGSARISQLNNRVGRQRLLLPRGDDADVLQLMKGMKMQAAGPGRAAPMVVVRASTTSTSTTTGIVKEVRTEVKGIYYNVTLTVSQSSDVAKWYETPGQFMDLICTNSAYSEARSFFIASPVRQIQDGQLVLEFLIEDVAGTVANELINSKPGDSVSVSTNEYSSGFDVDKLQGAEHVLMYASSYGIGSLRAFIETGFHAKQRKAAVLYTMYSPGQEPYMAKHEAWSETGVTIKPFQNVIDVIDPSRTVVLMNACVEEQEKLTTRLLEKRVPQDQILTLWDGIPTSPVTAKTKVLGKPNFLHVGELHVPYALKI